jgi:hypothetical protein
VNASRKDLPAGAIFIAFGLIYGYQSITAMPVGTLTRMGPGLFPAILSVLLILLGLGIVLRGVLGGDEIPFGAIPWRAVLLIAASTIVFAIFADDLGMLPGVFLTASIAAFAKRGVRVWHALLLGLCIAVFCSLLFTIGLGLPLPVLGSLITG